MAVIEIVADALMTRVASRWEMTDALVLAVEVVIGIVLKRAREPE